MPAPFMLFTMALCLRNSLKYVLSNFDSGSSLAYGFENERIPRRRHYGKSYVLDRVSVCTIRLFVLIWRCLCGCYHKEHSTVLALGAISNVLDG